MLNTLWIIIAIGMNLNMEIHHMDVKSAFLNGILEEEIYMVQPPKYEDGSNKVCKLHKAIYGLKQASRVWNLLLDKTFAKLGYQRSKSDLCLYFQGSGEDLVIVGVHVNDMTIATKGEDRINQVKRELSAKIEMSDLGPLTKIVGFEVRRDRKENTCGLYQTQYLK